MNKRKEQLERKIKFATSFFINHVLPLYKKMGGFGGLTPKGVAKLISMINIK